MFSLVNKLFVYLRDESACVRDLKIASLPKPGIPPSTIEQAFVTFICFGASFAIEIIQFLVLPDRMNQFSNRSNFLCEKMHT